MTTAQYGKEEKRLMIVVKIWEGLGNQMFQYAFARALQEKYNEPVFLDADKMKYPPILTSVERAYQLNAFQIDLKRKKRYYGAVFSLWDKTKKLNELLLLIGNLKFTMIEIKNDRNTPFKFSEQVIKRSSKNTYYIGHFQNEKYFKHIRGILLKEFQLKQKIQLEDTIEKIMRERVTIAVHIRRGDYVKLGVARKKTYYQKAINYIVQKLNLGNEIAILFFSDNIEWVKDNIRIKQSHYFINENKLMKDYEELVLMSKCSHNIISNSSFSWWGAWLNDNPDKIVVMPRNWMESKPHGWIEVCE